MKYIMANGSDERSTSVAPSRESAVVFLRDRPVDPVVTEGFNIPALPGAKRSSTNGHEMAPSWLGSLTSRFVSGCIGVPRAPGIAKCHTGVLTIVSF
jgi:hypothetical protein